MKIAMHQVTTQNGNFTDHMNAYARTGLEQFKVKPSNIESFIRKQNLKSAVRLVANLVMMPVKTTNSPFLSVAMMTVKLHLVLAVIAVIGLLPGCRAAGSLPRAAEATGHFTLWQLPSQSTSQMMSYVLRTQDNKLIVIDGGNRADAPYLKGFLAALGNRVHAWFISHPHPDHIDALTVLLTEPGELEVNAIHGSLPDEQWVARHEPKPPTHLESVVALNKAMEASGRPLVELSPGQLIDIDGVRIEILGVRNPQITANALNNSSVVMRVSDRTKSVLFTGDLGVQGGREILGGPYRDHLRADYVQMAHHGQNGVDENFYRMVSPEYCLWPTPRWLWENDAGDGKGTGPWQTLTVRRWMEKLKVHRHYLSADGLQRID